MSGSLDGKIALIPGGTGANLAANGGQHMH